jgi:hypothetical protein
MVRLRVCLMLAVALLLLGNGAWTPANNTAVADSLVPEGLTEYAHPFEVRSESSRRRTRQRNKG